MDSVYASLFFCMLSMCIPFPEISFNWQSSGFCMLQGFYSVKNLCIHVLVVVCTL